MSGNVITPPVDVFGSMHALDLDSRAFDWTKVLAGDGVFNADTVATAAATLVRRDGVALSSNDLAIVGTPLIDPTSLFVLIRLQAGSNLGSYLLTMTGTSTAGKILYRNAYISVVARLG